MRSYCLWFFFLGASQNVHAQDERAILMEFYQATGGDSWQENTGWGIADNICDWYGIRCEGEGDDDTVAAQVTSGVTDIELYDNNLNGRVPDALYALPSLEVLHLSQNLNLDVSFNNIESAFFLHTIKIHNTATSTLAGIGNIKSTLRVLHVAGISLNSVIPSEIWSLIHLRELILAEMNLQGTISEEIGNLQFLELFNVYENSMTGPIPAAMATLTNLKSFTLSRNQFTGPLPTFVNDWTQMEEFYVEENQFTGTVLDFARMPNLGQLYLSNNFFEGNFADNFLQGLADNPSVATSEPIRVDLAGNKLTGIVPASLDRLENVPLRFNLQDNQFTAIDLVLCDNTAWDDGNPAEFSCDAILCPAQTFNPAGRRTPESPCQSCLSAEFMGQSTCSDQDDRGILTLLYQSTGGDGWLENEGWLDDDYDICDWYGIVCWDLGDARDGRVRHIHLDSNNLIGAIPQNVYALQTLTTMTLTRNKVILPFTQISDSPHMHHINIGHTDTTNFDGIEKVNDFFKHLAADGLRIQGTIPKQVFGIKSLTTLSMSGCELGGVVSEEIAQLQNLTKLYLYENNLRGPLPEALGDMPKLEYVSLAKNQLTGVLPASLDRLINLKALALTDQTSKGGGISGDIPSFETNIHLTSLLLSRNRFEGPLPANLLGGSFGPNILLTVDVSNNLLTGTVPGGLARFDKMELSLENNLFVEVDERLCTRDDWQGGNVRQFGCDALLCPQFTTSSTGRQIYDDQECKDCKDAAASIYLGQTVCGAQSFPPTEKQILQLFYDVCGGTKWKESENWYTDANICDWYGIECDEASSVVSIVLGDNGLTGTVPSEIFKLPNLNRLSLFTNDIDFEFDGIGQARNLHEVVLDSTNLSSLKGVGLGRALTILNVRATNLGGGIPEELSRLVNLETLILSDNNFVGHLPVWLNQLPRLEGLMLARNKLSGPLLDFGGFENMIFLDLGENKLEGTIPDDFLINADTDQKIFIDLSHNHLKGTVPSGLARLSELNIHLKENRFTGVSPELCALPGWNNGMVTTYGCNAIMCPANMFNSLGRQQDEEPCQPCPRKSKYWGSIDCTSSGVRRIVMSTSMVVTALVTVASCVL